MQVVIDIDDNLYTRLFANGDIDAVDMLKACAVIRKGTPLSKELIIADKFIDKLKGIERLHINDELRNSILNALYTSTLETESEA